jgi:fatty acid desaturase
MNGPGPLRFARYAVLRSIYPLLAFAAVWGSLAWGPWAALPLGIFMLHAVTWLERWSGPTPADLVTAPSWLGRFLSHPEDVHGLIFWGVHLMAQGSGVWIWLHPEVSGFTTPVDQLGFALGAGLWIGWSGGVNMGVNYHSHAHKPVFRNAAWNRWAGRLWTLPGGIPSYWWSYKHLAVHHSHLGEDDDWVQPKRRADGRYENLWRYCLAYWPWRWGWHFWQDFRRAKPSVRRKAWKEAAIFAVPWSIPFFVDPWMGLGLWLYPAWVGGTLVMGMGMYTQHAGGTDAERYSHTTTFLSHWGNLTMFNAGFHIEHHERPGVHWSELPRVHAEMKEELIAGGAHVVGFGLYRGSSLLNSFFRNEKGWEEFARQHPEYVKGVRPPEALPGSRPGSPGGSAAARTSGARA